MSNGQASAAGPPLHRMALNPRPASIEGREYNNWGQSVKESAAAGAFSPQPHAKQGSNGSTFACFYILIWRFSEWQPAPWHKKVAPLLSIPLR